MSAAIPDLKVILVGQSGVGKTSIANAFEKGEGFGATPAPTIFLNIKYRISTGRDGNQYKLMMWDTAGAERFAVMNRSFYRRSHAALVVYDVTSRKSFEEVAFWLKEVTQNLAGTEEAVLMLIGNKTDLADQRAVPFAEGAALARAHDMLFVETSAKSFDGINHAFDEVLEKIIDSGAVERRAQESAQVSGATVDVGGGSGANGDDGLGQGYCC